MIDGQAIIVILGIVVMLAVLLLDKMRPGFTLFAGAICFMAFGVISPEELIGGFASREMITVAMLFLVGEGVRQSGSLGYIIRHLLPPKGRNIGRLLGRVLPVVTSLSMVLNNTAVVIIFAPIIKRWADRVGIPATKFLIPLSYATILGGMCTLIGTSTNMVVNGLMVKAGYRGFTMFEIGQVGFVIAVVGLIYLLIFSNKLLPGNARKAEIMDDNIVEVVLTTRFPGFGKTLRVFDFQRHYGAKVVAIVKSGVTITDGYESQIMNVGDTLRLATDGTFIKTWRESSAFHIVTYSDKDDDEYEQEKDIPQSRNKRWLGMGLLLFMIFGATLGEHFWDAAKIGIFPLSCIVVVIMAIAKLFPAKRYTKYITWDILVAMAAAFAISRAMSNSGINEMVASWIVSIAGRLGNHGVLAILYLVTMLLTEVITNSAAVAIAFPIAMALGIQLGIDPMPLFVTICIAASASFSSPIGYQTNLIVQGIGGYNFKDYVRIGIWLNIITFIISVLLIPQIWSF